MRIQAAGNKAGSYRGSEAGVRSARRWRRSRKRALNPAGGLGCKRWQPHGHLPHSACILLGLSAPLSLRTPPPPGWLTVSAY